MFNGIGSKLKLSAWVILIIGVVTSIFIGVLMFVMGGQLNGIYGGLSDLGSYFGGGRTSSPGGVFIAAGILIIIFGCALSYVLALMVNGFGLIVQNTQAITAKINPTEHIPDAAGLQDARNAGSSFATTFSKKEKAGQVPPAPAQAPFYTPQGQAPVQGAAPVITPAPAPVIMPAPAPTQTPAPAPVAAQAPAQEAAPAQEPAAAQAPAPEAAPVITPASEEAAKVKYCGQCGTPNEADYAFCMKCGHPFR